MFEYQFSAYILHSGSLIFFSGLQASSLQYSSVLLALGSSELNTVLQIPSHKYPKAANPFSQPAAYSVQLTTFTTRAHCWPTLSSLPDTTGAFPAKSLSRQPAPRLGLRQGSPLPGCGTPHSLLRLMGFLSARSSSMGGLSEEQPCLPAYQLLLPVRRCPQTS